MKAWLTATPPTPNGELHIGHMAGPYLAVDVLRRFLTAQGAEVLMTTGLDDHQSYVHTRALRDGQTPEQVADSYGARIVSAWWQAGIEFDRVVEPRVLPGYTDFVRRFFAKLHADGAIVPRMRPLPYCTRCEKWLYEAYVSGGCPHCGAGSNGNACEACGRPNECGDLLDPACVICGEPAQLRDQERLFLPLAPFADRLAAYWAEVDMPPHLRVMCERMYADGLPEIAVSHPSTWGVRVPVEGFEDQRIYVWFEMAPGYLLEHTAVDPRPDVAPTQFFGFDNGYFHAVLFPALFMAWDSAVPLAKRFVVNEFYQLEGKKFSTSRRHAVWALEGLAECGQDVLRWHVLRDRPQGRQTSFSRTDLKRARDHLEIEWNGWLAGLFEALAAETGGKVPDERPSGTAWTLLEGRLTRLAAELQEAYSAEGFDSRRAVDLLDEVVCLGRDYGFVHEHERHGPASAGRYRAALAGQLAVAAALAAWAAPVLPQGCARLSRALGLTPGGPVDPVALAVPAGVAPLAPPDGPIFGR